MYAGVWAGPQDALISELRQSLLYSIVCAEYPDMDVGKAIKIVEEFMSRDIQTDSVLESIPLEIAKGAVKNFVLRRTTI